MKTYRINEIFLSLQGEGLRAGTLNVFIRFSRCNQTCLVATHGFDCDTEFASGTDMALGDIAAAVSRLVPNLADAKRIGVILTGGEPLLQADTDLCVALHGYGFALVCVETNGSLPIPQGVDYVVVAPKFAEHTLKAQRADELRYVRRVGQAIPVPSIECATKYVSPAFGPEGIDPANVRWCIGLVHANPGWALTMQYHKLWGVR